MAQPHKPSENLWSRRNLLENIGVTAAVSSVGAILETGALSAADPSPGSSASSSTTTGLELHRLHGIDPKKILDEYERRELEALSDSEVCRQATAIISRPPAEGGSSFTLHAPLELMARAGLLPLVDPRERKLARLQLIASAVAFESSTIGREGPAKVAEFSNPGDAKAEFTRVFEKGDADGLEAIIMQYAVQFGTAGLVELLTPLALPTLSGASHSHIGLWLLLRHGRTCDVGDVSLLRAAARALASDRKGKLKSFSGMAIEGDKTLKDDPAQVEKDVIAKLKAPKRGKESYGSMRALVTAGEATGNADSLFADFVQHELTHDQIDGAFRGILRTCAHNMLQHDEKYAKFGWSHCLTLPQAACGLSTFNINRRLALATALVWITAYRSVLSDHDLDLEWKPAKLKESPSLKEALQTSPDAAAARVWYADSEEIPSIKQALATEASIRTDQHLIKYTRACMDATSFDPSSERLYLSAAAHLCSIWVKEMPEEKIKEGMFKGKQGK
jgi:hypothetical protein